MELDQDFKEFIACCVAREVRFLIVGGYALAAHGHPRYTKDLDVWILVDRVNADRLVAALRDFGFDSLGVKAEDLLEPNTVIQLGYEPKRIDILTSADGIEFSACYERRFDVRVSGLALPVPFLDVTHLIENKRASGRLQDLADVAALLGEENVRRPDV